MSKRLLFLLLYTMERDVASIVKLCGAGGMKWLSVCMRSEDDNGGWEGVGG